MGAGIGVTEIGVGEVGGSIGLGVSFVAVDSGVETVVGATEIEVGGAGVSIGLGFFVG